MQQCPIDIPGIFGARGAPYCTPEATFVEVGSGYLFVATSTGALDWPAYVRGKAVVHSCICGLNLRSSDRVTPASTSCTCCTPCCELRNIMGEVQCRVDPPVPVPESIGD